MSSIFRSLKRKHTVDRDINQPTNRRGTRDAERAGAFLTAAPYPHVLKTGADALQVSRNLFLEFIDNVGKANAQSFGNRGACHKTRLTVMTFNKADRGPTNADLPGKRFVREPLLLTEPGELVDYLFCQ